MPTAQLQAHNDLSDSPRVVRTSASGSKPPATNAAPSVFALGQAAQAAQPKPARAAPQVVDLSTIEIKANVPLPPVHNVRSNAGQYAALYQRMAEGDMVELPGRQAKSFAAWAKKGHDGKAKLAIRRLGTDRFGVWRMAEPSEKKC